MKVPVMFVNKLTALVDITQVEKSVDNVQNSCICNEYFPWEIFTTYYAVFTGLNMRFYNPFLSSRMSLP
jgi:hypothetical protein